MSVPESVAVLAPAKVNLWLEVLGRREDGYHEIRTWMLAIDLCDRIEARRREGSGIGLELRGDPATSDIPSGRSNLAWRGAEQALRACVDAGLLDPEQAGIDLVLEKIVPSQAGLGGGSSDAAAAWVATTATLGLKPGSEAARAGLSALGSDCVFFLEAAPTGAALCTGRGEQVQPVPAVGRDWWIPLLSPDLGCPTAQVYAALRRSALESGGAAELPPRWFEMPAGEVRPFVFNRLEAAALEAVPRLRAWREALEAAGKGLWHLSGSGSSFFALCDDRGEAEQVLERARRGCGAAGLAMRGGWLATPAGHGAKKRELT